MTSCNKTRGQLTFTSSSLYFFSPTPSGQSKFWCESPQGKRHLNTVQINTRDVTYYDVRGGIGVSPHPWRHPKTGTEVLTVHITDCADSFLSKYGMDSKKCLWCSDEFFAYRHYAKCCGKLYHYGCRIRHTWERPSFETFCPHCKTINLGEPYMLPSEWYKYNLKCKTGKCFDSHLHKNWGNNYICYKII